MAIEIITMDEAVDRWMTETDDEGQTEDEAVENLVAEAKFIRNRLPPAERKQAPYKALRRLLWAYNNDPQTVDPSRMAKVHRPPVAWAHRLRMIQGKMGEGVKERVLPKSSEKKKKSKKTRQPKVKAGKRVTKPTLF